MKVEICVGSSCHLKGSYDVILEFQRLVKAYNVESEVEVCASFCLGNCSRGVATMINGESVLDLNKDNCEEVFKEKVLKVVRG